MIRAAHSSVLSLWRFSVTPGLPCWLLALLLLPHPAIAQYINDYPDLTFTPGPVVDTDPGTTEAAPSEAPAEFVPQLSDAEPESPATLGELQRQVDTLSAGIGPFDADPERLEALMTLGMQYQATGEHEEAITQFDQAIQLIRVSEGLFSERQVPLMDAQIASHLAQGDADRADEIQASRLYLIGKNHETGSDALLVAQHHWAQWNIAYFLDHYLYRALPDTYSVSRQHTGTRIQRPSGARSAQLSPFHYERGAGPLRSGRYLSPETSRLNEAEALYGQQFEDGEPEQRLEALKSLLAIAYYRNQEIAYRLRFQDLFREINPVTFQDAQHIARETYLQGRTYITDMLNSLPDANPLRPKVQLMLADWHLVFGYRARADEAYGSLYTELEGTLSGAELNTFFQPERLVLLPTSATHQFSRRPWMALQDPEASGHLDARLDIVEDGSIRGLSITSASPDTPDRLRLLLRDHLDSVIVRPPVIDGQVTRAQDMRVRFHYTY